jgi:hypothetical protein
VWPANPYWVGALTHGPNPNSTWTRPSQIDTTENPNLAHHMTWLHYFLITILRYNNNGTTLDLILVSMAVLVYQAWISISKGFAGDWTVRDALRGRSRAAGDRCWHQIKESCANIASAVGVRRRLGRWHGKGN